MASKLAQFQTDNSALAQMQNSWASILNPIVNNAANSPILLQNVLLTIGRNSVNHKLGKKLSGWTIVRKRANAAIYDNQDANPIQNLTLILISDADVEVDILVF